MLQDTKLIQRNLLNSCILTWKIRKKLRKWLHLQSHQKIVKYLRIKLLKEAKDLYSDHYEMLVKEIKDDTGTWSDIPHSWVERINTFKMTILSKAVYRFNAISIKLPRAFFTELEQKKKLQFVWKHQRPQVPKAILIKKQKMELHKSGSLSSDYTEELQSSKQYGTGGKKREQK